MALVSCGTSQNEPVQTAEPVTVSQTIYKEETLGMPEDYLSACKLGFTDHIRFIYQDKQNVFRLADYDSDMNISSSKELFSADHIWKSRFCIDNEGKISSFIVYAASDGEIGTQDFFDKAEGRYELRIFSADGQQENVIEIPEMDRYYDLKSDYIQ